MGLFVYEAVSLWGFLWGKLNSRCKMIFCRGTKMLLLKNRLICSLVVDTLVELFHVLHAAAIQMSTIQGRVFPPVIETESRHPHTALKLNSFHCISTYHREWMEHGKSASNRNWMFLHSKISIIVIDGNESFHMKVFRLYRQLYNCWQFMSYDMTYNEELIRAKLTRKIESIHINIT